MNGILDWAGKTWNAIPAPLAALLVLGAGWLAALAMRFLVSRILLVVKFDAFGKKVGLAEFLRKGNVTYSPSRLAGVAVYWLTLLAAFLAAARTFDLDFYEALTGKLVVGLPNVIAGILIIVVGFLVVSFIANFVLTIALNASLAHARLLSKALKLLGQIIVATMALEQIGLGKSLVESAFQIILAAVAFGAALSFGLGCKDMARDFLKRILSNLRERERDGKGADMEG